jgi:single-strand DNA-binding protein
VSQANQMVCWGNLTRDPEIRYFEDENSVTNTGMAINKSWTDPKGKKQESQQFFDLSIYGKMGENVVESMSVGDRVMVVGSLNIKRVEDPDGSKKVYPQINVEEIGHTVRWATTTVTKNPKAEGGGGKSYSTPEAQF